MKKRIRVTSIFLAVLLTVTLTLPVHAAGAKITFWGEDVGFVFEPGSTYTTTDLFNGFKGVMPGDVLTDTIQVRNNANDTDFIKLYMQAIPHDGSENEMSPAVAAANQDDLNYMYQFLSKLDMEVYYNGRLIYRAKANELDGLRDKVYLGEIERGEMTELTVKLMVPIELDNYYANRVGEVDWLFTAESFSYPHLIVQKPNPVYTYPQLIQTGQLNWPIPVLACSGIGMMLFGLYLLTKKRKNEYA